MSLPDPNPQQDSAGAREYNRVKRVLELGDLALNLGLLIVLLATGWTSKLASRSVHSAENHYWLQIFLYVLMLSVISKVLGIGLDFYGFRLEHRFHLSNQKFNSWLWDESKGWILGLVIAAGLAEIIYGLMRFSPDNWWIFAWIICLGLFVLLAQIAPVVLLPLFYKFAPLQNEDLKSRLLRLGERAGP